MKKLIGGLLLFSTAAMPAFADDSGFSIGANWGSTSSNYSGSKTATAVAVEGGYQFIKYFAVEVQYGDFGDIAPSGLGTMKVSGFRAAGVGIYPLNDQWSIFGKLGVAGIATKISGTGTLLDGNYSKTAATYGIGGQFNFDPSVGVRLSVDQYKTGGSRSGIILNNGILTVVTLGVNYKF
jgi:OOP family OmpA-OmpF porin